MSLFAKWLSHLHFTVWSYTAYILYKQNFPKDADNIYDKHADETPWVLCFNPNENWMASLKRYCYFICYCFLIAHQLCSEAGFAVNVATSALTPGWNHGQEEKCMRFLCWIRRIIWGSTKVVLILSKTMHGKTCKFDNVEFGFLVCFLCLLSYSCRPVAADKVHLLPLSSSTRQ